MAADFQGYTAWRSFSVSLHAPSKALAGVRKPALNPSALSLLGKGYHSLLGSNTGILIEAQLLCPTKQESGTARSLILSSG